MAIPKEQTPDRSAFGSLETPAEFAPNFAP
jgi:hypothetical protein